MNRDPRYPILMGWGLELWRLDEIINRPATSLRERLAPNYHVGHALPSPPTSTAPRLPGVV